MAAVSDDTPTIQHDDSVKLSDGRKSVSDDDGCVTMSVSSDF